MSAVVFAFPSVHYLQSDRTDAPDYKVSGDAGMSLRDYFAGKALDFALRVTADNDASFDHVAAASTAYAIADQLLKAREGQS